MTEKQLEPYVTFKIYKNGQVTIEYKGKTLTTRINTPEFASLAGMLALNAVFSQAVENIGRILETLFEGEKKDEPGKT